MDAREEERGISEAHLENRSGAGFHVLSQLGRATKVWKTHSHIDRVPGNDGLSTAAARLSVGGDIGLRGVRGFPGCVTEVDQPRALTATGD